MNTIYKSKKSGECFGLKSVGERVEIDLDTPLTVDLKKYKKTGHNNAFEVYELKNVTAKRKAG